MRDSSLTVDMFVITRPPSHSWVPSTPSFSPSPLPQLFVLAALLVQQLATSASSPSLLLSDPSLATTNPLLFSAPPASVPAASALLEHLGPLVTHLDAGSLLLGLEEDPANKMREGAGTSAVGVQFEELDLKGKRGRKTVGVESKRSLQEGPLCKLHCSTQCSALGVVAAAGCCGVKDH